MGDESKGKPYSFYVRILRDSYTLNHKGVINATGPFTDGLRKVDDEKTREIVASSAGVHVIISSYYCPRSMSLLDPDTSDGRVIFFLPLQGNSIAGTTNSPTEVSANPVLKENEVQWILQEVAHHVSGGKLAMLAQAMRLRCCP